jgi:uncharacterized protein
MTSVTKPSHHSLSTKQFTALARGGGDATVVARLVAGQRSKHMILLAKVAEMARRGDYPEGALARAGWDMLVRAQRHDPGAVSEVISYPSVGAWALHVIRTGETWPDGQTHADGTTNDGLPGAGTAMTDPRPGGLASIAAAAAIRAGVAATIEVPVTGGTVLLPSLGAADAVGHTAVVDTGAAEVHSGDLRVPMHAGARGWREIRRITADALDVLVDDLDPFRMPATDGEPTGRLASPQLEELRAALRAAWPVLSPASAAEVATIVRVIVPYRAPESGHVSTSSPQAFGTVAMSRQPDKYTCAETLVHETQHLKLCALLDLVSLTRPDDGQRYYAPWRTDPRPASGLLQGAYAFLGVSGFWREQRRVAPEEEVRQRAQAGFARWRDGAALVVETLLGSGQLTEHGQDFAGEMAAILDRWRSEPVPGDALDAAQRKAGRHLAQWRADNG